MKTTFVRGGGYDTIDVSYASLKILAGHFFEENEKVYLIAGTEVSQNLYGGENCSIFIYNVTDDKVVLCELLDNAVSMTAICEAGNFIYFATISSSRLAGCDLYRYSKSNKSIEKAAHFEQRGVYALAFDGDRNIIAEHLIILHFIYTIWKPRVSPWFGILFHKNDMPALCHIVMGMCILELAHMQI